jgi:ribulose bisphosphate carboxylase small subunit
MGNIASVHLEQGHLGELFHNDRSKPTKNSIFKENKIIVDRSATEALDLYNKLLKERTDKYVKRTGRKLQKKTQTLLSLVVNIKDTTTLSDLEKLANKFEEKFGATPLQIAIHRDEGWIDESGQKHINHHAHIMLMGLDSEGYSIKRKIKTRHFREMQDWASEILQMERGKSVRETKRKRLNTYEYKEAMKFRNATERELKKELKKEMESNKKSLQNNENLNKKTIQKYVRIFEKSIEKYVGMFGKVDKNDVLKIFETFLNKFKSNYDKVKAENEELKKANDDLSKKAFERWQTINSQKEKIQELEAEVAKKDEIIEKVKELDSVKLAKKNRELKLTVKQLQSEISSLRKQMISINKELQEQDKNPAFTRDDYQYLSKLKKELKADTMQDVYNQVMQLKQKVRNKSKNFGIDM